MPLRPTLRLAAALGAALLVVLVPLASAATRTWTGAAGSTNFSDPGNWGGAAPVDGDDVVLVRAGVNTTYLTDVAVSLRSLTLADNGGSWMYVVDSVGGFGLASGGSFVDANVHRGANPDEIENFDFTLHGPATIEVSVAGAALDLVAPIVGTGPLTLLNNSGADALRLRGSATYSGATTIGGSFETEISSGNRLPTGTALTVSAGAGVKFDGASTVGSLAGAGSVVLSANTLTVGGDGTDTTFSGIASGAGGLTKAGTGTLTVSGVNTYTGLTTVSGGTLRLTGTIAGNVTVEAGATLVNLGTISGTVTNNGGTVQTLPSAPTAVTANAGNRQATVSFAAPPNGGSPITSYRATASPGGATASGSGTSLVVTGLTNGTSYTFTVTATTAIGTGPASAASSPVTPTAPAPSPDPSPPTPAAAPEPPPVVVIVETRDVRAPSAPAELRGSVSGGLLSLAWAAATDDVGVERYRVFRGETLLQSVTVTQARVRTGPGAYTVRAVDAAGNAGPAVGSIVLERVARPKVPKAIPAWAWKLLAWQQRGSTGRRPATAPKSPGRWYATWRAWRLQPFRIVT
jgi:autotransporter-associated beta strand protein